MSVYYNVYAEANIDGKWYSLCPYFMGGKDKAETGCIFWAQSVFWEVNNDLEGFAIGRGIPDDMSAGLREVFHEDLNEEVNDFFTTTTWSEYYKRNLYYVNFAQAIVPRVNKDKPFMYEGYVNKRTLAQYECYELEAISEWLTEDEYRALSDKRKKQYVFHRWNDYYGEYGIYRTIADRIWVLRDLFEDICESDIRGSIYDGITDSQIRVYVKIS